MKWDKATTAADDIDKVREVIHARCIVGRCACAAASARRSDVLFFRLLIDFILFLNYRCQSAVFHSKFIRVARAIGRINERQFRRLIHTARNRYLIRLIFFFFSPTCD